MAGLILGYAQKGGIADIEAAKPEAGAAARRRRGAGRQVRRRVQGLYRPSRRQGRACGRPRPSRPPPTARSTAPTSTPRAGCSAASAPSSRRATRARTGRSSARFPNCSASRCRSTVSTSCARRWSRTIRARPRRAIDLPWAPPKLDAKAEGPVAYPIQDFYLTNAICRASPTMHRCSEELVHGADLRRRRNDRALRQSWGMTYEWAWFLADGDRHPGHRPAAACSRWRWSSMPSARSGRRSRCAAGPMWSGRGACCRASPTA